MIEEISVNGKILNVPSMSVCGHTVVAAGKRVQIAQVKDEEYLEADPVDDPDVFVETLKEGKLNADIFTFCRRAEDITPKYPHLKEWDNAAVIPISSYAAWLEKLSQDTRRNVRKAAKAGVVLRQAEFNDELVRGISEIYNETPVRQGQPFWHYGKDVEHVKRENGTFLDRSVFIGAYWKDELIGFVKMVYVGKAAKIMQILSKNQHYDKRPANALIAKAVEISAAAGMEILEYCKYVYGKNDASPLTEFKRRSGFEKVLFPRYFIPLTLKGRVALALRLHNGVGGVVPKAIWIRLLRLRARFYERMNGRNVAPTPASAS